MTYSPKTWNIQLILAQIYLETSKTRPSISLLEVILSIFHPFSKDSKISDTETKHVKTSFLKACLPICMENIQHEELKDQLTLRRS